MNRPFLKLPATRIAAVLAVTASAWALPALARYNATPAEAHGAK